MTIPNHRRSQKKEGDEDDEYMSHKISYKWFRRTYLITSIGLDYKKVGRLWRFVRLCEELSGGQMHVFVFRTYPLSQKGKWSSI